MDSRQNTTFKMYQTVAMVCTEFATDIATNPTFKSEADEFAALIPEIRRIDSLISDDRTLVTSAKNQTKDEMCALALDVAQNIKAVGIKTNDETLKMLGQTTKSSLTTCNEEKSLQQCTRIATKARDILPALNGRGMDTALLEELEAAIEGFKGKKPEPQNAKKEKTALIAQLSNLFERADMLLDLMEATTVNFKRTHPEFCGRFETATTVQSPIKKGTRIKFMLENALTGELLTNFNVLCPTLGFNTFVNGVANPTLDISNHADAQFIFTKEGFHPFTLEHVKITRGQVTRLVVKMMPIV